MQKRQMTNRTTTLILTTVFISIVLFVLTAYNLTDTKQNELTDRLDKYMQAQVDINNFSGTVLIMKQNKVVLKKAYGLADREWNISNAIDTKFRIGSITKQFTAVGILQLQQQGKLSVQDKLSKYISNFPKGDSITIHMLLTHSSGIKNYIDLSGYWPGMKFFPMTVDSMITTLKQIPLDFSPGTKWNYSNSGYLILGYIIEKVSGEKYRQYIQNHVLKIAGMDNSGVDRPDTILYHRARGYSKINGSYINAFPWVSPEIPSGEGAMYSTVEDLYKWDKALSNTTIISESSKKQMFTPYWGNYGYGFSIDVFLGHARNWHNGAIDGYTSTFSRFPNDSVCVVVLSNNEARSEEVAHCLSGIMFSASIDKPHIHKVYLVNKDILMNYEGSYEGSDPLSNKIDIKVVFKEGKLFRIRSGSSEVELIPESENKFYYSDGSNRHLEFKLDAKNNVIEAFFINSGIKSNIHKIN